MSQSTICEWKREYWLSVLLFFFFQKEIRKTLLLVFLQKHMKEKGENHLSQKHAYTLVYFFGYNSLCTSKKPLQVIFGNVWNIFKGSEREKSEKITNQKRPRQARGPSALSTSLSAEQDAVCQEVRESFP